jgi:hypothetical protein
MSKYSKQKKIDLLDSICSENFFAGNDYFLNFAIKFEEIKNNLITK